MTDPAPPPEGQRESRWQFSLRGILILLLLLSCLLMVFAPTMRDWSKDQAILAALQLVIVIIPSAIVIAWMFLQERAAKTLAGPLIATVYRPGARDRVMLLWLATAGIWTLVATIAVLAGKQREISLCVSLAIALGGMAIIPSTFVYACTGIVPGQVELCSGGLIESGRRFIAPERLSGWSTEGNLITLLLDADDAEHPGFGAWQCQIDIPKAERERVLAVLRGWRKESPQDFPPVTS